MEYSSAIERNGLVTAAATAWMSFKITMPSERRFTKMVYAI